MPKPFIGLDVVIDAVNSVEQARNWWRELADRYRADLRIIECVIWDEALHGGRLAGRMRRREVRHVRDSVEPGETPVETLIREVLEETGLAVKGRPRLLFTAKYQLPDVGAWVAQTFECEASGVLQPNDPDGFIVSADWVPLKDALARLDRIRWYDSEPLRKWLTGDANAGASYEAR